jgi:hypothetical protein
VDEVTPDSTVEVHRWGLIGWLFGIGGKKKVSRNMVEMKQREQVRYEAANYYIKELA